jgi:hypothetical protein
VTSHYLQRAGCATEDPRLVSLVSLATQKFIHSVALEARQLAEKKRPAGSLEPLVLTTADVAAALFEHGVTQRADNVIDFSEKQQPPRQ